MTCRSFSRRALLAVWCLAGALLTVGAASSCTRVNTQLDGRLKQRAICSFKQLEDVPTMPNEQDVEDFLLTKNHIRNLHDNSFAHYVNVSTLILDQNLIEQISENAFKPLRKLRKLDISKNYLTIRDNRFLRPLFTLRELHMGNREILLDRGFFEHQRDSLVVLSLEGTLRLEIREGAFSGLHRLQVLNLTNCNLKTLPNTGLMSGDLDGCPLKVLSLADNPWECDCRLRWLVLWHRKKQREQSGLDFSGAPTCAGPRANGSTGYRGMTSVKLFDPATHVTRFQCLPEVFTDALSKTVHRVNEGDNVTMTCSFFSDPKGQAVWLFGSDAPFTVLPLQPGYQAWQSAGETNFVATLAITGATARDSRLYKCSVSNERGNASLQHQVTVDTIRSGMGNRKLVIIVSIGAVIVITCALMIGGVFFYHYSRSGGSQQRRRLGPGQKVQHQPAGQPQHPQHPNQLPHQQPSVAGYSQLMQSRENNGYYTADGKRAAGRKKQLQQQQRLLTGAESQAIVPLTAELPLDVGTSGVDFRSATLPLGQLHHQHHSQQMMQHQHSHAPWECPVHGSTRQLFPLCPLHGSSAQDSRSGTPGSACTTAAAAASSATLPLAGSRPGAATAAPRPCPLHGDLYSTIAKSTSSTSSTVGAGATYVRASKVDDCIPEGSDLLPHPSQRHPPLDSALRLPTVAPGGSTSATGKPNPQDDEGYSTAV